MKAILYPALITAMFTASAAAATTLQINQDNSTFGRVGGVVVTFGEDAPAKNWSNGVPQNGITYTISSVTFTKNNNDTNLSTLYLGVYDSVQSNGTTLGNFLGVSNAVSWSTLGTGDPVTFNFSGVELEAANGQQLVFSFQTDTDPRTNYLTLSDAQEGWIGLRRMDNTAAFSAEGAAILHGAGTGIVNDRVPHLTLNIIPEPTAVALSLIGAFGLVIRRRR